MQRVSSKESAQLSKLVQRWDSLTLRTMLTTENQRTIRPERLRNLTGGTGRLSDSERAQLAALTENQTTITALIRRSQNVPERRRRKALRDFTRYGKEKGVKTDPKDTRSQRSIRALKTLQVDQLQGNFYMRRGKDGT